jgi:hypothetical protein
MCAPEVEGSVRCVIQDVSGRNVLSSAGVLSPVVSVPSNATVDFLYRQVATLVRIAERDFSLALMGGGDESNGPLVRWPCSASRGICS